MSSLMETEEKGETTTAHPFSCGEAAEAEEQVKIISPKTESETNSSSMIEVTPAGPSSTPDRAESSSSDLDLPILTSVYVDELLEETEGPTKFSWRRLFTKGRKEKEPAKTSADIDRRRVIGITEETEIVSQNVDLTEDNTSSHPEIIWEKGEITAAYPFSCGDASKAEEQVKIISPKMESETNSSSRIEVTPAGPSSTPDRAESPSSDLDLPILTSVYVDELLEETEGSDTEVKQPTKFSWKRLFTKGRKQKEPASTKASVWKRFKPGKKKAQEGDSVSTLELTPTLEFDFDRRKIIISKEMALLSKSTDLTDDNKEASILPKFFVKVLLEEACTGDDTEEKPDKSSTRKKLKQALEKLGFFTGLIVCTIAVCMVMGLVVLLL